MGNNATLTQSGVTLSVEAIGGDQTNTTSGSPEPIGINGNGVPANYGDSDAATHGIGVRGNGSWAINGNTDEALSLTFDCDLLINSIDLNGIGVAPNNNDRAIVTMSGFVIDVFGNSTVAGTPPAGTTFSRNSHWSTARIGHECLEIQSKRQPGVWRLFNYQRKRLCLSIGADPLRRSRRAGEFTQGFGFDLSRQWSKRLVTVYDPTANQSRLYLNGVLVALTSAPELKRTESPRYIGAHSFLPNSHFFGDVAELMIYDTGLTEKEALMLSKSLMDKYKIPVAPAADTDK